MLGRDEQIQPGFVDFCPGAVFKVKEFQKPTKWDFARTVIQGWFKKIM